MNNILYSLILLFCGIITTQTELNAQAALKFDGSDDRVALPNDLATDFTASSITAFTIEYWFKGTNIQSVVRLQSVAGYISSGWHGGGPIAKHIISTDGGLVGVNVTNASATVPINPIDGNWHHVAVTWQRNTVNGFKSYLDGVLQDQRNSADVTLPAITSGAFLGSDRGSFEFMNGAVDELRIWTRALPLCEIQNNKNCELGSGQTGLLAYYKFNQSAGTTLTNATVTTPTNRYDGTLLGFALTGTNSNWVTPGGVTVGVTCTPITFVTPSVSIVANPGNTIAAGANVTFTATPTNGGTTPNYQWKKNNVNVGTNQATYASTGLGNGDVITCVLTPSSEICALPATSAGITMVVAGAALNFDGANDYVALPNSLATAMTSSSNSAITIEYWFKGTNPQSVLRLQSNAAPPDFIISGWSAVDGFKHAISTETGGLHGILMGPATTDWNAQWNHIAMTWQRNTINGFKSYLNGVLVEQRNSTDNPLPPMTSGACLGADRGVAEYTNGSVDELRIWTRALPQCEIVNNMSCKLGSGQTNLLACYKFDENAGTSLTDGANSYTGTLTNFALTGPTSNWLTSSIATAACMPISVATASLILDVSPSGTITSTTNATFTATPTNGGTTPIFQWRKNNVVIGGANLATYATTGLLDGDIITCVLTPSGGICALPVSQSITISANAPLSGATLNFDGANDYVALPNTLTQAVANASNTALTIEYRFKGTNLQSAVRFQGSGGGFIIAGYGSGTFQHVISTDGGAGGGVNVGSVVLNNTTWNHIAMTWQRNTVNGFKSYLNGVLVAQRDAADVPLPVLTNGGTLGSDNGTAEFTNGSIDEVRIWNRALPQCELVNNRDCELGSGQTSLLAYYKFNQTSSTTLTDDATAAHTYAGTLTNFALANNTSSNWLTGGVALGITCTAVPLVTPSVNITANPSGAINASTNVTFTAAATSTGTTPSYQWRKNNVNVGTNQATYADAGLQDGDVIKCIVAPSVEVCALSAIATGITMSVNGAALNLDGTNDHIALPNSLVTAMTLSSNTALTIEYWFKGTNPQSGVRLQSAAGYIITGWSSATEGFKHAISTEPSGLHGPVIGPVATNWDAQWNHIAMTWQRNTVNGFKSYLNGVLVEQRNSANVSLPTMTSGGFIGSDRGLYEFANGSIDELRIWNRALSQSELQTNKNCELGSGQTGLLAYYKFNQKTGTSLTDATANNYSSTLTNFALTGSTSNWKNIGGVSTGNTCAGIPLSVDLLDFKATPSVSGNLLTWITANEINNKGFEVQRITDGQWTILGFVEAKGKNAIYNFTDKSPLITSYYRLRQIDFDGKETLSKVVSVSNKENNKLKVYPNPVSNVLMVETDNTGDFYITNLLGQRIISGKAAQRIDVSTLPVGTYFLKIGEERVKFVRQ